MHFEGPTVGLPTWAGRMGIMARAGEPAAFSCIFLFVFRFLSFLFAFFPLANGRPESLSGRIEAWLAARSTAPAIKIETADYEQLELTLSDRIEASMACGSFGRDQERGTIGRGDAIGVRCREAKSGRGAWP